MCKMKSYLLTLPADITNITEHYINRNAVYDAQTNKRTKTNAKIRDSSPISTREAITASSVADAPCGGNNVYDL